MSTAWGVCVCVHICLKDNWYECPGENAHKAFDGLPCQLDVWIGSKSYAWVSTRVMQVWTGLCGGCDGFSLAVPCHSVYVVISSKGGGDAVSSGGCWRHQGRSPLSLRGADFVLLGDCEQRASIA